MIIIGIHGAIGHGKTTLANQLEKAEPNSAHFESSAIIAEVLNELHRKLPVPYESDPVKFVNEWFTYLPQILKQLLHLEITAERLRFTEAQAASEPLIHQKLLEHAAKLQQDPTLSAHKISLQNKSVYRAGLQGLGGYLVAKASPTIWYEEIVHRMLQEENKGRKLCVAGGLRFPVEAELLHEAGGIVIEIIRPNVPERDRQDPTEAFRKDIKTDVQVLNNGSEQQLYLVAQQIIKDCRAGTLQKHYAAN